MDTTTETDFTLTGLLRDLRDDATALLRSEAALAKTELREKATQTAGRVSRMAVGGGIILAGLIVLLLGAAGWLALGFQELGMTPDPARWLADCIVGIVVALIGWAILGQAKHALSRDSIAPEETVRSMRETKTWARSKFQHDHEPAV